MNDAPINGPEVWRAADVASSSAWRFGLPPECAKELVDAARAAAADGSPVEAVDRSRFRLDRSVAFFEQVHAHVEHGMGFALIEDLPFDGLSYPEKVALTCGLSDYVGRVVVQNYEGQRIVDVHDEGIPYSHQSRGYRSNKHLPFHTDGAHLFSLTCLSAADDGGETILVSASAVYNALLGQAPQAIDVLRKGFYHHRRGQHDPGESVLSPDRVPVFAFHDDLLHCCYNRNPIEWAEKEGIQLTKPEREALDAVDNMVTREDMQLRLRMRAGECLVVNNFIALHSRTEYTDSTAHKRHMLRVWMHDPKNRRNGVNLLDLYVPERLRSG